MKLKYFLIIGLGIAAGVWWAGEKNATARLQAQLEGLRRDTAELLRLRREHERLAQLQPATDELDRLRREIAARGQTVAEKPASKPAASDRSFQIGNWVAPTEWKNSGRATPEAALETVFWAAAGGELGLLKDTFEFDDTARARAEAVLASLPEASARSYATPDDLLTLLAAREIPVETVQWYARTVHDADNITTSVAFKDPNGKTSRSYLTFHRGENGWRLVVPASALERMTKELASVHSPKAEL